MKLYHPYSKSETKRLLLAKTGAHVSDWGTLESHRGEVEQIAQLEKKFIKGKGMGRIQEKMKLYIRKRDIPKSTMGTTALAVRP